ncbi:hypothetical protein [Streptosporangium sp. KLBMP 9127]|nr:hypothetical protein [Streptosporangium sp. KLBMP 9127]
MNPFGYPGGGRFVHQGDPLRPWRFPGHRNAYVLVDDMVRMYATFCRNFSDLGDLDHAGHLVLVTGRKNHGKSTLLGGCAAYLQRRADLEILRIRAAGGPRPRPLPRVWVITVGGLRFDNADDRERYREVTGYLMNRGVKLSAGSRVAADAAEGYAALSNDLQKYNNYVVVLLPPIDTLQRLSDHMRFARRRIVFLAESSPALLEKLTTTAGDDPRQIGAALPKDLTDFPDRYFFHMHVGPLKPDDYLRYIRQKLRKAKSSVQVDENAVNDFRDQRPDLASIGKWRDILNEIFESADLDRLQHEHFAPYLLNGDQTWKALQRPDGDVV